jgi:hypothetical protein
VYTPVINTHRLSTASVDTSSIYEGVLKPENITIHVAQNLVDLIASTLAWTVISTNIAEIDDSVQKLALNGEGREIICCMCFP